METPEPYPLPALGTDSPAQLADAKYAAMRDSRDEERSKQIHQAERLARAYARCDELQRDLDHAKKLLSQHGIGFP